MAQVEPDGGADLEQGDDDSAADMKVSWGEPKLLVSGGGGGGEGFVELYRYERDSARFLTAPERVERGARLSYMWHDTERARLYVVDEALARVHRFATPGEDNESQAL